MATRGEPELADLNEMGGGEWWAGSGGFTRISFSPDVGRFRSSGRGSPEGLSLGDAAAMAKRVYDVAGCLSRQGVTVHLNGAVLPVHSFGDYIGLHWPASGADSSQHLVARPNKRWEIGVVRYPTPVSRRHVPSSRAPWTERCRWAMDRRPRRMVSSHRSRS